ncbi:MAG: hypothetical protein KDB63_08355 [Nocardioidaceae bacterium]|nr:hypothetical protein [Nocardioidaceae bacterium]
MYTVGTDLVLQAEMHYRTERMQRSWRPLRRRRSRPVARAAEQRHPQLRTTVA